MSELFIVKVKVIRSFYMNDDDEVFEKIRLVEADNETDAYNKVEKHYDSKTEEYDVYYRTDILDVSAIIR